VDFFQAQEQARRRSGLLVALFGAAVVGIIAVVYLVAHVGLRGQIGLDPLLLAQVALGVGVVVGAGSATRIASLRSGGPAVAEMLGARRVAPDTTDVEERKLLNVVEEMALASGTPVPAVYVLDREEGINAFAAGYTIHDAAVAVTRGGIESLTRDELQGVIAHEFSHILNGDMRLNVRLIGLLNGILLLAIIGRGIVYFGPRGGGRRGRDNGAGYVVLIGIALLLVGYIGVFFGKLIKAAVSRQREYLADSAAIEFTRNPDGLAGALKKIAAASSGSRIHDHHAEELSHLFFANGLKGSLFGFLSTHPPIDERIRRLDPSWSAADGPIDRPRHAEAAAEHGLEGAAASAALSPLALAASAGKPRPRHLAYARELLESLPGEITVAAHEPGGASALILALVAAGSSAPLPPRFFEADGGGEMTTRVRDLLPRVESLSPASRLPLVDLALPALDRLSPAERATLHERVERIASSDGSVRLFDLAILNILRRRFQLAAGGAGVEGKRHDRVTDPEALLLSALAWAGAPRDQGSAAEAFTAAAVHGAGGMPSMIPRAEIRVERIEAALAELAEAPPADRRRLLERGAAIVLHDRQLAVAEVELLRAISEALDCPLPPIVA
jgi:Zn-dependent protease with chaperone function